MNKQLKEKGLALLGEVGLKERAGHKPNELSGGEQQRVAIARALINNPQLILCDEPTGNLDSETGQSIMEMLLRINRQNNQTLVIVTHDENIAGISKNVIHMCDGKLISEDKQD